MDDRRPAAVDSLIGRDNRGLTCPDAVLWAAGVGARGADRLRYRLRITFRALTARQWCRALLEEGTLGEGPLAHGVRGPGALLDPYGLRLAPGGWSPARTAPSRGGGAQTSGLPVAVKAADPP